MTADTLDTITTQVASLVVGLRTQLHLAPPAVTPVATLELAQVERITKALAELNNATVKLHGVASAHQLVRRIHLQLRSRYGRRVGSILAGVMGAPIVGTDELVAVLLRGRADVRAALNDTDDPAARAALFAALRALDELHSIETNAPKTPVNVDESARAGSSCEHSPATLTRCTHHRRHLVKLSSNDADPAPAHHPGAMTRRYSPCIGGC